MFNRSGVYNTCNKPPKWKIITIPSKTNTRYSIILNQKRDFQQSVEKFLIEVPNWNKMSSCCIADNSVNAQNMNVIFLDEHESCSCLSLRLFHQKQFLTKKSNSLLVFLNKLKKGEMYTWQNTFIYIKCTASQKWVLFYDLFEFLIKNLGNTVIGTQFYINFICNNLIIKELFFLRNIKENQEFEDFILPLSEVQLTKTVKNEAARIVSEREFSVKAYSENNSKEDCKVSSKKRKSIDPDYVDKYKYFKSSCNRSKKCCKCKEKKWQYFKPLIKYVADNYTDILEAKGVLNKLEITQTYSEDSIIYSNVVSKGGSVGEKKLIFDCSVKTSPRLSNQTKQVSLKFRPYHAESELAAIDIYVNKNELNACNMHLDKENIILQNDTQKLKHDLGNNQKLNNEHFSDSVNKKQCAVTQKYTNSSEMYSEKTKGHQNFNPSFMTFQTAHGKPLKVSKESFQIAQKIYTEVCSQVIDANKTESNVSIANLQKESLRDKHNSGVSTVTKSTSSREYFDDNIDTALDDKFFEEISFNEKGVDQLNSQLGQSSYIPSNVSFKALSGKARKSLGVRRSINPYMKK